MPYGKIGTRFSDATNSGMTKMKPVLFLICLAAGSVLANEQRIIYDFEYGIFSRGMEEFKEGNRTVTSEGPLDPVTVIPARLGTKFGIRYWLSRGGFDDKPTLHLIYHVPTMVHPNTGEYIDKIEILQEASALDYTHTMAFEFAEQYELVPGEYRFYIFFENQKLLEQVFQVVLR
ncbi:MAG: DUF3859 domain-containing protein [Proteobacteria bacterium]|nr:DUF3859 domain-containing protein [Pseudomonadota bacterium]